MVALVEDLCKYYGFHFKEHPNLILLTSMDLSAKQMTQTGGLDAYKYNCHRPPNLGNLHIGVYPSGIRMREGK